MPHREARTRIPTKGMLRMSGNAYDIMVCEIATYISTCPSLMGLPLHPRIEQVTGSMWTRTPSNVDSVGSHRLRLRHDVNVTTGCVVSRHINVDGWGFIHHTIRRRRWLRHRDGIRQFGGGCRVIIRRENLGCDVEGVIEVLTRYG